MGCEVRDEVSPLHAKLNLHSNWFAAGRVPPIGSGQFAIFLDHQLQHFFQVAPHLGQSSSLRICSWDLFDPGNVPAPVLLYDGSEFSLHRCSVS